MSYLARKKFKYAGFIVFLILFWFSAKVQLAHAQTLLGSCPLAFYDGNVSSPVWATAGATVSGSTTCPVPAGTTSAVITGVMDDGGTISINGSVVATYPVGPCALSSVNNLVSVSAGSTITFSATAVNSPCAGAGANLTLSFYGSPPPPPPPPSPPPNCDTSPSCSGSCSAPANTCSTNNGTQPSCVYTAYSGGGSCNQVSAPDQPCTIDNCSSGSTCSGGTCVAIPPPPGPPPPPVPLPPPGPEPQQASDVNISWSLINPLFGSSQRPQPQDVFGVVLLITDWFLNIAGSLIVILIIYAGVRFVLSRGNPGEIQKARSILWWALVGFAIVLIGKGFIFLVNSVLRGEIPLLP